MLNLIPSAPLLGPSDRICYLIKPQGTWRLLSSGQTRPDLRESRRLQQIERGDAPRGGVQPGAWIGARTDLIEARDGGPVRPVARQRPPEVRLVEGGGAGVDIAADEARVAALELGRGHDRPPGDRRGEVLDLAGQPGDDPVRV